MLGLTGRSVMAAESGQSSADLRRIILAQYAAYEALDVEKLLGFYTEDCVFDDHTFNIHLKSRNELGEMFRQSRQQVLAIRFELLDLITNGRQAVSLHTQTGTAKLRQTPAAEPKNYTVYGVSLMEFAGKKIKRQTDFYDVLGFRKQVGLRPPGQ